MSNLTTAHKSAFLQRMAERERQNIRQTPRPMIANMNGNTGIFSYRKWDDQTKKYVEQVIGDNFLGTIVAVRYYCQSQYKEGARRFWKTKEFTTWSEPVTLQCIDQDSEPKVQDVETYSSYKEFKKSQTLVNPTTKEETYSYSLHSSLFVFVHDINQVVCFQSKIGGTNGLFDYFKSYQGDTGAEVMVQVKTVFGSLEEESDTLKNPDGTPKRFFSLKFSTSGLNDDGELAKIEEMVNMLDKWFETQGTGIKSEVIAPRPEPTYLPDPQEPHTPVSEFVAMNTMKQADVGPTDAELANKDIDLASIPF